MPKYDHVSVQLTGQDGNAFFIMGTVIKALRKEGISDKEINDYMNKCMNAESYNQLLRITMDTVNVL